MTVNLTEWDAERFTIGSWLWNRDLIPVGYPAFHAEVASFQGDDNRVIAGALWRLKDAGRSTDVVTLIDQLTAESALDAVGGPTNVSSILYDYGESLRRQAR